MATKARQQYHADEATLSKERREFSISDDVQEKIDGIEEGAQVNTIETIRVNGNEISPDENKAIDLTIPGVIDSLSSTSITDALSARQGKILYDKIDNISRIGHFLALWDASTGLPVTDPEVSPYEYHAGDFYTISVVASQGGTNYKPSGTEYISGQASTAVETDDVEVNDFYFYDGQVWRHMKNSGAGDVVVDGSLSTTSRNPVENRVITNALSGKQNTLTAGANIQINGNTISATDTKYTAGTGISIANGVISNTQTSAERGNITGTLSDQTDLQTVLTSKATDANVVHKSGAETIAGTKTFSTSPVVPSKTTAATNTGTAIATEAQVYKKQDKLVSGTNIKTVNNNSLLGSGNLTLNDVKVSSTAPSSPTEGMTWYDTTNDVLKVYDGTNWNVTGKEYHAGEGIEIGTIQDYSAMQGPAPDGFHVPLNTEWQAVYDIWTALGGGSSDGTNFGIALKLPFAGYRFSASADVNNQGTHGHYWSSSRNDAGTAYRLYFYSTALKPQSSNYRANGFSVRCFKNSPTVPTSSWTKLYGTSIEAGGIFWSSTDGLISLSSDGTDWITIADKNLGATTVWNSGDTLSEANCGKYYQWGNNYGFPRTGSVTTSSTQVDASTYGPGNYYSSSTFITRSSSSYRWDTTDNGNLWGGVTGVTTLDNAITNTGVLSVNGQTGDVTISTPEESNTKTFYLSSTSDLTNAQAAYDWYLAGKNPIIRISGLNYSFILEGNNSEPTYHLGFYGVNGRVYNGTSSSSVGINPRLELRRSSNTVTSIVVTTYNAHTLFTDVDYSKPYTPTYNGSPATKKYVDDSVSGAVSKGTTAPSNPTEGQLWYDTTNDQLKVYDGANWNVVGDESADINTKTFYLSNTSDLTTAQAAYDWYLAGKNPIIVYGTARYNVVSSSSTLLLFVYNNTSILSQAKVTSLRSGAVKFTISNGSVTGITVDSYKDNILKTDYDYQVPYMPQYNGSPATKKYVDDSISAITIPTYTAGDNVQISSSNVISATDTTYNAGTGIGISNNTISNTGVTFVNGQTGNVMVNEITFSEEAPANPSTGAGWFDYNDDFRIYSQDNSWKLINNVYKTYTPKIGENIGYYSDLRNKIIVFSFNEDMSDRWIVTDLGYGDWNEKSQMYMSYKIIAIGQVADDADTTFISQRGLTRPKGMATLEITATNDGNGNFICSNIQFKEIGSGGFKLAPNSPLTPKYRRYGTQAQYDALTQYYTDEVGDTVYFTI